MSLRPPDLRMGPAERDDLLAQPHIAVLAVGDESRAPLLTPVWYRAHPDGDIVVVSPRHSRKVKRIERGGAVSFLVQSEAPPRYVSVEVEVDVAEVDEETRRAIAARYVPAEALDAYLEMTEAADAVLLRLRPTRWHSSDLTKVGEPPAEEPLIPAAPRLP